MLIPANKNSKIKKVIGVISGKGGVGKSSVTCGLAVLMQRMGYKTAVLDADMTGPSVPKTGIKIMSINLLLGDETAPVLWRGPIIAGTVKQFFSDVIWGDIDFMFVDCPPGTGDVPLTVFQSLPLDGVIVVTTPQDLVSMIVAKAVRMADQMDIPVLGMVENMSYFECPDCGKRHNIFGESKLLYVKDMFGIKDAVRLPINPEIAELEDKGRIEDMPETDLKKIAEILSRS